MIIQSFLLFSWEGGSNSAQSGPRTSTGTGVGRFPRASLPYYPQVRAQGFVRTHLCAPQLYTVLGQVTMVVWWYTQGGIGRYYPGGV